MSKISSTRKKQLLKKNRNLKLEKYNLTEELTREFEKN